jgi:hypothetical protein
VFEPATSSESAHATSRTAPICSRCVNPRGMLSRGFGRLPVRLRALTLDLRERDAAQPRLALEDPKLIAGLDALELPGIAAEHRPGRLLLLLAPA